MEYASEDFLNIEYGEKRTNFFKKHKIMSMVIVATIMLTVANIILIYMFFNILQTL